MTPRSTTDRAPWIPRADVEQLRAFVAVARQGSVVRAADVLGRTQPTISARLAGLEREWETRLFRRVARGMTLTPEGTRLLPLAESILRQLQELDRAAGLPVASAHELRVGAGDALGRERLPCALARLLEERPGLEIQLREGSRPVLLEALRAGEIDLAFVVGNHGDHPIDGIDSEPWLHSAVLLLSPDGGRFSSQGPAAIDSLEGERLVSLQSGSGFRRHLERAFDEAGLPYRPAVEVGNLSLVRRFVAAQLGMALVPEIAFSQAGSRRGVTIRPTEGIAPVVYHRCVRRGVPLPGPAERLLADLSLLS